MLQKYYTLYNDRGEIGNKVLNEWALTGSSRKLKGIKLEKHIYDGRIKYAL